MARIRTIKPEFWTSEQVGMVSRDARLLFVGLWNFCDDSGIHPASLWRLKAEIFPCDPIKHDELARWITELVDAGLLEEYETNGGMWWRVTGWHHQLIRKPNRCHPLPDGTVPNDTNGSTSPVTHQCDTGTTHKGREGRGKEGKGIALRSADAVADAISNWGDCELQKADKLWKEFGRIANLLDAPRGKDGSIVRKGVALETEGVIPEGSMRLIAESVRRGKNRKYAYVTKAVQGKLEDAGYPKPNQVLSAIKGPVPPAKEA